jgi:predicted signal transduction protein with EAL and GGDEF domain
VRWPARPLGGGPADRKAIAADGIPGGHVTADTSTWDRPDHPARPAAPGQPATTTTGGAATTASTGPASSGAASTATTGAATTASTERIAADVARRLADGGAEFTLARLAVHDYRDIGGALGPAAAAELQARVGQRLAARLRPGERYAALPDGTFTVLLDGALPAGVSSRLADLVANGSGWTPDVYGQLTAGASLACDVASADDLLAHADLALAEAGRGGPGTVRLFAPDMLLRARARVGLDVDLRRAVEAGQLTVHYQPVVALGGDGGVVGYEALARWPDKVRGWVKPDEFIPAAERSGLIAELGRAVVRRAISDLRRYGQDRNAWVSVNVSALQLDDDSFARGLLADLIDTGVPGDRLRVEVTESALLDSGRARRQLAEVRHHGVRVLVDDFGTGYSSLASLRKLPIDGIKIARELLHGDEPGLPDPTVVHAVRLLADGAGVDDVIAEGVESEDEVRALSALGVPFAQGFHLGKPAGAARALGGPRALI